MSRIFAAVGRFSVRMRWLVVAVWIAVVAATMAAPNLNNYIQGNNQAFLPASAPSVQAARLAAPFGATDLQPVPVVAVRPGGQLTAVDTSALAALRTELATVPGVNRVLYLGRSPDGRAGLLVAEAQVSGGMMSGQSTTLINAIRAKIAAAHVPAGLQTHLAGDLAGQVDSNAKGGSTANGVLNIAALLIIVLLIVIFRSLLAPLITLAPAFLAVIVASGVAGEAAKHGMRVSSMAQILLIVLVLGAGTDYGLFLVFRTREELRGGREPRDAVVTALTRVGESITFSAGTVLAALASLLVATFPLYRDMAAPLMIGVGLMLLIGLTLLPALLAIFGRAAFWPARTAEARAEKGAGPGGAQGGPGWNPPGGQQSGSPPCEEKVGGGAWARLSARIVRRPAAVLAAGVVVFGVLAAASANYKAGGFGGQTAPAGSDSAAGDALLAAYFPQAAANPTSLVFSLGAPAWQGTQAASIGAATARLEGSRLLHGVTGPLDPAGTAIMPGQFARLYRLLGAPSALASPQPPAGSGVAPALYAAYRAAANYVSPDGRTIQFAVGLAAGDPGTTAAMNAVPAVRAETARVAGTLRALAWGVAGQAPAFYDTSSLASSDLARVIPVAIAVIGLLLGLVLRSVVAPWYLIASVALSYFAALGTATLIFIDIHGASGVVFILPLLMFLFLLALGEDYNILVMTRIREEVHGLPLRAAVARALSLTGITVTSAGLVLAGTFAVFAIVGGQGSGGSMVIDVGTGVAVGILMDTFVVRTLLVPATVVLLGRWNWWPSRLGQPVPAQPDGPELRAADAAAPRR
jgi:putative drug exporter of the RND superfamily